MKDVHKIKKLLIEGKEYFKNKGYSLLRDRILSIIKMSILSIFIDSKQLILENR